MIVREFYEKRFDGVNLYKTFSDAGFYIKQNPSGVVYSEAIDIESAPYTYEETDKLIESATPEKAQEQLNNERYVRQ